MVSSWASLGSCLVVLGTCWGCLGLLLGAFGFLLGAPGQLLGCSWAAFGQLLGVRGLRDVYEATGLDFGTILLDFGVIFNHLSEICDQTNGLGVPS